MCDVTIGHAGDWKVGDGALPTNDTASAFVDGSQVHVHVTCKEHHDKDLHTGWPHVQRGKGSMGEGWALFLHLCLARLQCK